MGKQIKKSLCTFLGDDREIKDASNKTRTTINQYRNSEGILSWNTFHKHTDKLSEEETLKWIKENLTPSPIETRPAPQLVSEMTENIVIYLNRTMQYLHNLMVDEDKYLSMPRRKLNKIMLLERVATSDERKEDLMLFSSKAFIELNNLDSTLFKQVISTIYNKWDKTNDSLKMKIPALKERTKEEFPEIYNSLFGNRLEEQKRIMMNLRNTAGHSDLAGKIIHSAFGNPLIWIDGERKDLYSTLGDLSHSYLEKAQKVYSSLAKETRKKQGF